ncbi:MAG: thioredoxin domain-containing protein [Candidatus Thermoplasmatota archaeon]|nr:thioredoxin domain-containing protein [Candidatus Thermoplasmatota archaeon]
MKDNREYVNRLVNEKSPYLLQHSRNPVDWYPWSEEAFERAREMDRPIFLSIGYSTCHWCHVMERESFEDPEVAEAMNRSFVSIKVDREERPDIDAVYMKACQLATGKGGWPLTVIMTPEKEPFFLGTYIPKSSRWGMMGLLDLIREVSELWRDRRDDAFSAASEIGRTLSSFSQEGEGEDLHRSHIGKAVTRLKMAYDRDNGGFGNSPKFPSPHQGMLMLRYWKRTGDAEALDMVKGTLDAMISGGIHDHIGGGFHRYSTDRGWRVPHFEKMLYDQAMMSILLSEAYLATNEARYSRTLRSTLEYVMRDLSDPEGGFHSAEDADSEGEEGKFYVWSYDELGSVLDKDEFRTLDRTYDLRSEGNFKDEATGVRTGGNILFLKRGIPADSLSGGGDPPLIEDVLIKLRKVRDRRIRPQKDDKVLTDWNALMISALARASRSLKEPSYAERAERAASFILGRMRKDDGTLFHRYRDVESTIDGFLEDHSFMVQALLDLYEATLKEEHLKEALSLNRLTIERFQDEDRGGFFQISPGHEALMMRNKEAYDGAIPSGNSVQMLNLVRIARMTGDHSLEGIARMTGRAFSEEIGRSPSSFAYLLCALDMAVGPSKEIVIAGSREDPKTRAMVEMVNSIYFPNHSLILNDGSLLDGIVRDLRDNVPIDGIPTAYLCSGGSCSVPARDLESFKMVLRGSGG